VAHSRRRVAVPAARREKAAAVPLLRPDRTKKSVVRDNPQKVDLGPLPKYFGYYFRRLQQAHKKHFARLAADIDVSPKDVGALFVMGLNPGLTPTTLGSALALDAAQVANLLKDYEWRGLATRKISAADGRSRVVFLTAEGKARLEKLRAVLDEIDASFVTSALTAAESAQLLRLLSLVLAANPQD